MLRRLPVRPRTSRPGARGVGLATLAALAAILTLASLAAAPIAEGAQRHRLRADANIDLGGSGRYGVHLANRPGGFYMGRMIPTTRFDRTSNSLTSSGIHKASNDSEYVWGFGVDRGRQCFWVGPVQNIKEQFRVVAWTDYLESTALSSVTDRCSDTVRSRLANYPEQYMLGHVNCPHNNDDGLRAKGPTWTKMLAGAPFYYNLDAWTVDSNGVYTGAPSAIDQQGDLAAGQDLQYRYTTKDGRWAAVYVPGRGWGFVAAHAIQQVSGWWTYDGWTHKYALCGESEPTHDNDGRMPQPEAPPPPPPSETPPPPPPDYFQGLLARGDFAGDGIADILARDTDNRLYLYHGSGTGGIREPYQQLIGSGWEFDMLIAPGDFGGDGIADVLARDTGGRLYLYHGNGTGGFREPYQVLISSGWEGFDMLVAPGDFGGDGINDLLARDTGGRLYLYHGNGTGGFREPYQQLISSGWEGFDILVGPGDFGGDGISDILARDTGGHLYLYHGNGSGGLREPYQQLVSSGWGVFDTLVGPGDFGGDGVNDLLARDVDGRLYLYHGNGAGSFREPYQQLISSGWGVFD